MRLLKSIFALLVLPGFTSGLVPTLLIRNDPWRLEGIPYALGLVVLGLSILVKCVWDFHNFGRGTLAPWSPPQKLVNIGLYRMVRNPMYVGVICLIIGLAVTFGSPLTLVWLAVLVLGFHLYILLFEERRLSRKFPEEWAEYSSQVARWWPKLTSKG